MVTNLRLVLCLAGPVPLTCNNRCARLHRCEAQVAIGIGDVALAYQCLKIAISVDPTHAEAYNNLGVLENRKGNEEQARSFFRYVWTRVGLQPGDDW